MTVRGIGIRDPNDWPDELVHGLRRVGVVAVDEHVDVRLDLLEHAADDEALALLGDVPHDGAGARGELNVAVRALARERKR